MGSRKFFPIFGIGLFVAFCLFLFAGAAWAGFGISPPYVTNYNLAQGSHFESKIWLSRGEPDEDLRVEVEVDVPGASDWISIDKGTSFLMPEGEQRTPMTVLVDVPKNAEFKNYSGYIRLTTYPVSSEESGGGVAIVLGARIDVALQVRDIEIFDFNVKRVNVYDLEEGHDVLWWYSPGKISFDMEIENLGNVEASPTKVQFDIYDEKEENLLETTETGKMGKVEPFGKRTITAELSTKLPPKGYTAVFKIFKGEEIVKEDKVHLTILPRGTLNPIPEEWYGLQVWVWIVSIIGIIAVAIGAYLGFKIYKIKRKWRI